MHAIQIRITGPKMRHAWDPQYGSLLFLNLKTQILLHFLIMK